jgi:hypothetical protein
LLIKYLLFIFYHNSFVGRSHYRQNPSTGIGILVPHHPGEAEASLPVSSLRAQRGNLSQSYKNSQCPVYRHHAQIIQPAKGRTNFASHHGHYLINHYLASPT